MPRTGATMLAAKVLARISLGHELGAPDSPSRSRAIISTEVKGRALGYTRELTLPVTNVWVATGNNPSGTVVLQYTQRIVLLPLSRRGYNRGCP